MKKRVKWKKWILLGICFAFLVGLFCYWNREDELYSDVRLFSDGDLLFLMTEKTKKFFLIIRKTKV